MIGTVRHFCAKGIWRHRNWTIPKFPRWARLTNNDTQFVKFGGLQLLHTVTCGVIMIRISGLLTTAGHIVSSNIVCKYKSERFIGIVQNAKLAKWALHDKVF